MLAALTKAARHQHDEERKEAAEIRRKANEARIAAADTGPKRVLNSRGGQVVVRRASVEVTPEMVTSLFADGSQRHAKRTHHDADSAHGRSPVSLSAEPRKATSPTMERKAALERQGSRGAFIDWEVQSTSPISFKSHTSPRGSPTSFRLANGPVAHLAPAPHHSVSFAATPAPGGTATVATVPAGSDTDGEGVLVVAGNDGAALKGLRRAATLDGQAVTDLAARVVDEDGNRPPLYMTLRHMASDSSLLSAASTATAATTGTVGTVTSFRGDADLVPGRRARRAKPRLRGKAKAKAAAAPPRRGKAKAKAAAAPPRRRNGRAQRQQRQQRERRLGTDGNAGRRGSVEEARRKLRKDHERKKKLLAKLRRQNKELKERLPENSEAETLNGQPKVQQRLDVATSYVINMEMNLLAHQAEFDTKLRVQSQEFARIKAAVAKDVQVTSRMLARRRVAMANAETNVEKLHSLVFPDTAEVGCQTNPIYSCQWASTKQAELVVLELQLKAAKEAQVRRAKAMEEALQHRIQAARDRVDDLAIASQKLDQRLVEAEDKARVHKSACRKLDKKLRKKKAAAGVAAQRDVSEGGSKAQPADKATGKELQRKLKDVVSKVMRARVSVAKMKSRQVFLSKRIESLNGGQQFEAHQQHKARNVNAKLRSRLMEARGRLARLAQAARERALHKMASAKVVKRGEAGGGAVAADPEQDAEPAISDTSVAKSSARGSLASLPPGVTALDTLQVANNNGGRTGGTSTPISMVSGSRRGTHFSLRSSGLPRTPHRSPLPGSAAASSLAVVSDSHVQADAHAKDAARKLLLNHLSSLSRQPSLHHMASAASLPSVATSASLLAAMRVVEPSGTSPSTASSASALHRKASRNLSKAYRGPAAIAELPESPEQRKVPAGPRFSPVKAEPAQRRRAAKHPSPTRSNLAHRRADARTALAALTGGSSPALHRSSSATVMSPLRATDSFRRRPMPMPSARSVKQKPSFSWQPQNRSGPGTDTASPVANLLRAARSQVSMR